MSRRYQQGGGRSSSPARPLSDVLLDHQASLLHSPGVVGVGIGRCGDEPCIKIFITEDTAEYTASLPASIEGYKVDVIVSGEIRAL